MYVVFLTLCCNHSQNTKFYFYIDSGYGLWTFIVKTLLSARQKNIHFRPMSKCQIYLSWPKKEQSYSTCPESYGSLHPLHYNALLLKSCATSYRAVLKVLGHNNECELRFTALLLNRDKYVICMYIMTGSYESYPLDCYVLHITVYKTMSSWCLPAVKHAITFLQFTKQMSNNVFFMQ